MKLRSSILALVLMIFAAHSVPAATIGIYDRPNPPNGNYTILEADFVDPANSSLYQLTFYVVLQVEDLADAVSYEIDYAPGVLVLSELITAGPDGDGIQFRTDNGFLVGFGGCYPGFNQVPLVVARHEVIFQDLGFLGVERADGSLGPIPRAFAELRPNADGNPDDPLAGVYPMYSNCQGGILPATEVNGTAEWYVVTTESSSFGGVKALFGGE